MREKSLWRIGLVQSRSISYNFVLHRSEGLWSVDQTVSGRSTIAPLNGRPDDLIKTGHRTVKEKS